MTDTTKTEALRLAEWLLDNVTHLNHAEAAAELRRLSAVEGKVQVMLDASNTVLAAVQAQRDRLAAECEALRADAERYRTLVASGKYAPASIGGYWALSLGGKSATKAELDAAITAAMGGKESQGGNASGQETGGKR